MDALTYIVTPEGTVSEPFHLHGGLVVKSHDRPRTDRYTYAEISAAANAFNETNDCAVRAVCIATNNAYPKIHEMFKKMKRRNRCGTPNVTTYAVIKQLGYKLWNVSRSYSAKTVRSLGPTLPKGQIFLVETCDHMLAVVDSKVEDYSFERAFVVHRIWQVLHETEQEPDIIVPRPIHTQRWAGPSKVSTAIRNLAEQELALTLANEHRQQAPFSKRWWLTLRARVHAAGERHGLKLTTMSVELGKWQTELGYDMKRLDR